MWVGGDTFWSKPDVRIWMWLCQFKHKPRQMFFDMRFNDLGLRGQGTGEGEGILEYSGPFLEHPHLQAPTISVL